MAMITATGYAENGRFTKLGATLSSLFLAVLESRRKAEAFDVFAHGKVTDATGLSFPRETSAEQTARCH